MSNPASSSQNVIAASVNAPIINATGPGGIVTATTIRANTFSTSTFSTANVTANNVTANNLSLASSFSSANVTANNLTANNLSLASSFSTANVTANNVTANNLTLASSFSTANVTANNVTANVAAVTTITSNAVSANVASFASVSANSIASNAATLVTVNAGAVTTNVLTSNAMSSGAGSFGAVTSNVLGSNAVTLGGQVVLTATAQGIEQTSAPFSPITQSGINSIKVQGAGLAFQGKSFPDMSGNAGGIGTYSYITATANAYVNRNDPQASRIRDINYAPYDASGNVTYDFDVVILYPTDPTKYSNTMVYEAVNRGTAQITNLVDVTPTPAFGKTLFGNTVPSFSEFGVSVSGTGSGNGFLYQQGDMFVFSGWEGIRPQVLTDYLCATFYTNVISEYNSWPGQFLLVPTGSGGLGLNAGATVGLGVSFPSCYYDSSNATPSRFVTGDCTDYTLFSSFTTNTFPLSSTDSANVTIYNSFPMYYPFVPDSPMTVSISYGFDGVEVPLTTNLFYTTNGFGTVGPGLNLINSGALGPDFAEGFGGMVTPPQYNAAYCTINRQAIMLGTDGLPMTTAKPDMWTQYAAVLEADASGFLRDSGSEYTINYTGFQAKPMALGALGVRDLVSYLRYGTADEFTGVSTTFWTDYASRTSNVVAFGISSSSVFLKGFLYEGFNVSSNVSGGVNTPVFDGFLNTVGFDRRELFIRFGKQNEAALGPRYQNNDTTPEFPFTYPTTTDPYSGRTDGLLYKYLTNYSACVPKIYDIEGQYEISSSSLNLLISDPLGAPLPASVYSDYLGLYYIQGAGHAFSYITQGNGIGQKPSQIGGTLDYAELFNSAYSPTPAVQAYAPVSGSYVLRSCYWNMKRWLRNGGSNPLPSKFPSIGTLNANVQPYGTRWTSSNVQLQAIKSTATDMGFPNLSNLTTIDSAGIPNPYGFPYPGDVFKRLVTNRYTQSIRGTNTDYQVYGPVLDYPAMTSLFDSSGIGVPIHGIPTPETAAPLFSSVGYNLYQQGYGAYSLRAPALYVGAVSLASNSAIKATNFTNDPRPTIEALYTNVATWSNTWNVAVSNNITNGYMLASNIFPYESVTYTNRGLYQSNLLSTRHGVPLV